MNLDWLKSLSARIGIEGRNTIIVSSLAFCGFGTWLFLREYNSHPVLSSVFLVALFLLGCGTVLIGLLVKPQPSEVAEKFLLQQIGQQVFYAGGLQSPSDLVELLRAAHNVRDLPPPSGIVEGSAANEANHRELPSQQAEEIARQDREGVRRMIEREAEKIVTSLGAAQLTVETPKRIEASREADTVKPKPES